MSSVDLQVSPDRIATLTLNDPDRLNAMSPAMARDFAACVQELEDHEPRVIILRGAGRSFSAGGDLQMLEDMSHHTASANEHTMKEFYNAFLDILEVPVPLIGCLQGHAAGAGFCLACACDLRVGEENSVFLAPFLRLGLFPGMGATLFPPRVLGNAAVDLLLTGRPMKAEEAYRLGFLCRVAPPGQGMEEALKLAHEILGSAPHVTGQLLQVLRPSRRERLAFLEREAKLQGQSYLGEEFRHGLAAARAKLHSPFRHPPLPGPVRIDETLEAPPE